MKSKILYLVLFMFVFSIQIKAQVYDHFEDGTTIYISMRTISPITGGVFADKLRFWQIKIPNRNRLVRYITNENGGFSVGYVLDYEIINEKQFKVSIKSPGSVNFEFPFKGKLENRTLKNYPPDFIVDDGDIFALDLLESPGKEAKSQDLILLTKKWDKNRNYFSGLEEAKDFQINDIKLRLEEFKITINGIPLPQKSFYKVEGHILVFRFKNRGEIYLSLFPQKGFDFQKVGTIDGKAMSFKVNNDIFKITSISYIWNSDDVKWNLWGYYIPEEKLKEKLPDSLDYQGRFLNSMPKS